MVYPTEPSYVYAIRMVERHARSGIVVDVDLGFRHWRRNQLLTLAGAGCSRAARSLQVGQRYVVQTARRGHERGFVAWTVDTEPAYTYAAVLGAGHDGDNLRLAIDLGLDQWIEGASVRLHGGNARELADPGGPEAAANLRAVAPPGIRVVLRALKPDKYGGRYGARVTMPDGTDLTERLISDGWMARWDGRGLKPVPCWPRKMQEGEAVTDEDHFS